MIYYRMEITEETEANLETLREHLGFCTKKELLDKALSLLEWYAETTSLGYKVGLWDDSGNKKELVLNETT